MKKYISFSVLSVTFLFSAIAFADSAVAWQIEQNNMDETTLQDGVKIVVNNQTDLLFSLPSGPSGQNLSAYYNDENTVNLLGDISSTGDAMATVLTANHVTTVEVVDSELSDEAAQFIQSHQQAGKASGTAYVEYLGTVAGNPVVSLRIERVLQTGNFVVALHNLSSASNQYGLSAQLTANNSVQNNACHPLFMSSSDQSWVCQITRGPATLEIDMVNSTTA